MIGAKEKAERWFNEIGALANEIIAFRHIHAPDEDLKPGIRMTNSLLC